MRRRIVLGGTDDVEPDHRAEGIGGAAHVGSEGVRPEFVGEVAAPRAGGALAVDDRRNRGLGRAREVTYQEMAKLVQHDRQIPDSRAGVAHADDIRHDIDKFASGRDGDEFIAERHVPGDGG